MNGFMCINLKFEEKDKDKYWIFNKEVTKEEWDNRFNIGKPKRCSKCGQLIKIAEQQKMESKIIEMMSNRGLLNGVDDDIIEEIREELEKIIKNG